MYARSWRTSGRSWRPVSGLRPPLPYAAARSFSPVPRAREPPRLPTTCAAPSRPSATLCLLLQITGLNRFVGASYGTQQVNRHVEEAMVAYQREETIRWAQEMPPKEITAAQDETFTGGLCLVASEPVSNY